MKRRSRDSSATNLAAVAAAPQPPPRAPSPEPPPAKRARRRSSLTGGEEPLALTDKVADEVPVAPTAAPPVVTAPTSSKKQKGGDKKQLSTSSSAVASVDVSPRSTTSTLAVFTEKIDVQPFALGHCLLVKYRDNSQRLAKIIENMKKDDGGYNYYVHYFDFNRRMDEWIDDSRIVSYPSVANPLEAQYTAHHHNHSNTTTNTQSSQHHHTDAASSSSAKLSNAHQNNTDSVSGQVLTTIAELEHDEHEGLDEAQLKEHELITKVKNIQRVQLGKYIMECWYFSPFPKEYFPKGFAECLYFCEYSLRFFTSKEELLRFQQKGFSQNTLPMHPPGHEIYRDEQLSMFELDGSIERIYCQNLCYFAKLFLDHKTLFWDVDAFLFYVLCTRDERGFHPVGYFSKEKYSDLGYNLACILTFPCVQRRGFGRFLIDFSYELSKKEDKFGSPEKPLSDLGALGYKSYWAAILVRLLRDRIANHSNQNHPQSIDHLTIADLACLTSIQPDDIIATLQYLRLLLPLREYEEQQQKLLLSSNNDETSNDDGNNKDHSHDGHDSVDSKDHTKKQTQKSEISDDEYRDKADKDVPTQQSLGSSDYEGDEEPLSMDVDEDSRTILNDSSIQDNNTINMTETIVTAGGNKSHNKRNQKSTTLKSSSSDNTSNTNTTNLVTTTVMTGISGEELHVLVCDAAMLDELARLYPEGSCRVQPHRLHWTPFYVMDAKKDKWSLYHMRQAAQSNAQTAHVLSVLQQQQQMQQQVLQQQQQQQLLSVQQVQSSSQVTQTITASTTSSSTVTLLSGLTRSLSVSLLAGNSTLNASSLTSSLSIGNTSSSMFVMPTLSRQTTLLLSSQPYQ